MIEWNYQVKLPSIIATSTSSFRNMLNAKIVKNLKYGACSGNLKLGEEFFTDVLYTSQK